MSTASPAQYSADDLLTMPDGDLFEVVDGQLVERKMSVTSSWVAGEVHRLIANHVSENRLGWAFPEGTSYQCFPWDSGRARRPDASFVAGGRFEHDELPDQGHIQVAPDLAVEVVSPHDTYYEVDQKVEDYLEAGVKVVWVINPEQRIVRIHRAGEGRISTLHESDELSGEGVLPRFTCRVADVLPRKPDSEV
jgi:Uma2 family endonuclease